MLTIDALYGIAACLEELARYQSRYATTGIAEYVGRFHKLILEETAALEKEKPEQRAGRLLDGKMWNQLPEVKK